MASTSLFLLLLLLLFFSFANAGLGEHDGYGAVKVLGSRPPLCVNRCMRCRPCRVTLVAFPRGRSSSPEEAGDESYYLVAWMCRCGDSLFRP